MPDAFEVLIGTLWADLGLGAPPRGRRPARLTVDGRTVVLTLAADERNVVVSTVLGPLATDPSRQDQQLRRLLRDGAGLVLDCTAALRLAIGRGTASTVVVEAVSPCRDGGSMPLRRALDDVMTLADLHRPTLDVLIEPAAIAAPVEAGHLIFRL